MPADKWFYSCHHFSSMYLHVSSCIYHSKLTYFKQLGHSVAPHGTGVRVFPQEVLRNARKLRLLFRQGGLAIGSQ